MYLKVDCPLGLVQLAQLLAPEAPPESFEHDSESVYEWLYVTLPNLPFALNFSREHGEVDDAVASPIDRPKPGPVYIFGWDRAADFYVEDLPDWLAQHIADELLTTVFVYRGLPNRDRPDSEPTDAVRPHLLA